MSFHIAVAWVILTFSITSLTFYAWGVQHGIQAEQRRLRRARANLHRHQQ